MGMNEETHSCPFTLPPLTLAACCHPPSWLLPPWQAGPKHSGRFASLPAVEHHRPCSASPVLQALLWPTGRLAFLPQAEQAVSPIATHCLAACLSICCLSVSLICISHCLSVSACLSLTCLAIQFCESMRILVS